MSAYPGHYVGAEGQSYPEVAARAIRDIHARHLSPYYGYIRNGREQKIYLFSSVQDAKSWFGQHTQIQPIHDYAAVFSASNLYAPMPDPSSRRPMEHFMSATNVGNWWPFLLGLPLGGLGGYFLRRSQESPSTRAAVSPIRDVARRLFSRQDDAATSASGWYDINDTEVGGWGGHVGHQVGGPGMDSNSKRVSPYEKPVAISVLDEDGNLTGTFVRWAPTQDQISRFGRKRPQFYYDDPKGGAFVYNDPRGELAEVGPYLSNPYNVRALLYKPTWQVQFLKPSGELTDRQTAYKTAEAIYGPAYNEEQMRAQQDRISQALALAGQRPPVGGPWLDLVGAQAQQQADIVRRAEWPQTRALIQSAIDEVTAQAASYPAEAYVWTLDAPVRAPYAGSSPGSVVTLEGTTSVVPFSSQREALTYLREVAQTQPVALAMFERSSPHWPNPTAWRKSSDPEHASVIAQHLADRSGTSVSGQWFDIVGAQTDEARRREWPQTRALIQSAIDEVSAQAASYPAAAYVWMLDAPVSVPGSAVMLEGTTSVVPFSSQREALTYLREVAQTQPVALAMFERSSSHWPNPTAWRKSSDPEHASVIAQHVANRAEASMSGTYAGACTEVYDVRQYAQDLADKRGVYSGAR